MSIAVVITDRNTDALCQSLQSQLPGVEIQQWPHIPHPEYVKLAILWNHPMGITEPMNALQMVVSMGAGMDHIDADKKLSEGILKNRIVTPALQQNMAQYVLQYILADCRYQGVYRKQQAEKHWQVLETDEPMPVVGFMGLGKLGGFVAGQCKALGFGTMAWTSQQKHPQHRCYHGKSGLQQVCENSQYLVVLLPLNELTHHVINHQSLAWCHSNTTLINVARGAHVNTADLIQALDAGGIKQAILDVFEQEPLPPDSPLWSHPKITLTPHSSSRSDIQQTAAQVVKYYQSLGRIEN